MWDLDHKISWASENWCFWGVVLDKAFGNALDCKEIKPVYPKGNQPWIFTGKTDAEAEAPIFWPLDVKCWLIRKYPDYGKDWRQEEKGTKRTRCLDGITVWMDMNLNELGDGDGQESLICCSPWGHNESHTTEWLNNSRGSPHSGIKPASPVATASACSFFTTEP